MFKQATRIKILLLLLIVGSFFCIPSKEHLVLEREPDILSIDNPLPVRDLARLEDLTWMEVRDKIAAGYISVILPTGGIERNGPFVALNKHDVIVTSLSEQIAQRLPSVLVAPTVSFVPQGNFFPPSGHMQFPGTIGVQESTFINLLLDIMNSLALSGFKNIIILGDSGGNQRGMADATVRFNRSREVPNSKAFFIPQYYSYEDLRRLVLDKGYIEQVSQFHDEIVFSASLAAISPKSIRLPEREQTGINVNGVQFESAEELISLGKEINATRVERTVAAIKHTVPF